MRFRYPFNDPDVHEAERSMDSAHFDAVGNDPSVRPFLGGDGDLRLGAIVETPENYAFATPHGGIVLWPLGSGRYDVHSLFLPDGRGDEARAAIDRVAAYMFARTDCTEGRTTIPEHNRPAKVLAVAGGFEKRFELLAMPWTAEHTKAADFYALTLERWALTHDLPLRVGEWFHRSLDTAKLHFGCEVPLHPDEPVHNRIVGAAVMMIQGGQAEKGVAFYNAWSLATRYQPVTILTKRPVVIDIGDAILAASATHMDVLKCR